MSFMLAAGLAETLGINATSLIAQIIIIVLVIATLNKFAFGPVTEMLLARRKRIEEAEANFEKTKSSLASAEAQAKDIVANANKEADRIIKEANEAAAAAGARKAQEAVAEAAAIIQKAKDAGEAERQNALASLKQQFGRLVIDATSRVTGKVLTPGDHETINQAAAAELSR